MRIYSVSILLLLIVLQLKAVGTLSDSTVYSMIGKVYGEFVRQFPPYDIITEPLTNSNLSILELPQQGWLTDSTGCFQINNLRKGTYHLKAEFVGLVPCDTLIVLTKHTDTLRLVLPLWYEYISKYKCSPELSRANIRKGHPYIKLIISEGKEKEVRNHPFWKKYGVSYDSYYLLRKDGHLDCYLGVPNFMLAAYNQEVFEYLDAQYGKIWRREVPDGILIFGLDKSLESSLIAHTIEKHLEVGVPVCYLNEQGDTIVPYGKYKFCQTDTIRSIGFVYENKQDARIVCIDNQGKELFYVFKCDNGPDYIREGLFRIMDENGWIGFADSLGNVVIKPQFKFAFPFKGGKAKVTFTGEEKVMSDGEPREWVSNEWQYINKKGEFLQ